MLVDGGVFDQLGPRLARGKDSRHIEGRADGFGVKVREARRAKGWGQVELAKEAGVSWGTVQGVEGNKMKMNGLMKILRVLGLELVIREVGESGKEGNVVMTVEWPDE